MKNLRLSSTTNLILKKLVLSSIFITILFFPGDILYTPQVAHAASNPNLFVSVENSQFNNYFAGPQVVQVVVSDPDINRLDQAYGEPTVTVNGKKLRMAQATDGNWYAYFADRNQAIAADKTSAVAGKGLDFGQFCASTSAVSPSFSETKGFTVARAVTGSVNKPANATAFGACTSLTTAGGAALEHVVRENKTLNGNTAIARFGQIGIPDSNVWPIIQLYDFSTIPTAVTIDYQKAGGDQIVNLTFDRIPSNLISAIPDRSTYPTNSQVFIIMDDPQLNIDPTEEDSWTWGANKNNNTLFYQAFDRNGSPDADGTMAMQNLVGNLTTFMFNHNGKLTIDPAASGFRVIDFQGNGKQPLTPSRGDPAIVHTASIGTGSEPITFIEQGGVNTGVFGNWDGSKKSNIITVDSNLIRGHSATIKYNDVSTSIVGGFEYGSIIMPATNNTWASGQIIPVTLTDADANKNSKITEHLSLNDPNVDRITTMKIGTPFTLGGGNATFFSNVTSSTRAVGIVKLNLSGAVNVTATDVAKDEILSARPVYRQSSDVVLSNGGLAIDLNANMQKLKQTIHNTIPGNTEKFKGFNFLNYDIRSLGIASGGSITNVEIFLAHSPSSIFVGSSHKLGAGVSLISLANSTSLQDFINLNVTNSKVDNPVQVNKNLFTVPDTDKIGLIFIFSTNGATTLHVGDNRPVVADFFSIGLIDNGIQKNQRINNGVYRWELEETGDNTGVFTGTTRYVMLNQLTIFDPNTYSNLKTINHDVNFATNGAMLQYTSNAPQTAYLDLGTDGLDSIIAAQQDIVTHTGIVSFDHPSYQKGDTVTITLNDPDLNVNNNLVDIYTAVPPGNDPASDTIGQSGLGLYSDGSSFGELLQIKFDGVRWSNSGCFKQNSLTGTPGGFATSLSTTGFSLVETTASSGIFTGTFNVPDQVCYNSKTPILTNGVTMIAEYVDFTNFEGNVKKLYATSVVGASPQDQKYHISLKSGPFTPEPGINTAEIQGTHKSYETVHYLLQFWNTPTQSDKNALSREGINMTDYVSGNTYVASSRVSDLVNLQSTNNVNVRWAGAFKPIYKISYDLQNHVVPAWANFRNNISALTIQLHTGSDINTARSYIINNLNGTIIGIAPTIPSITAILDLDKINDTASQDFIKYVDFIDPPLRPDDNDSRKIVHVDKVESDYSLTGSGVNIMEYDQCQPYFRNDLGSIPHLDPDTSETCTSNHATLVAGLLAGHGSEKGMATDANVISYTNLEPLDQILNGHHVQILQMYNSSNDLIKDFTDALSHSINLASMSLSSHIAENDMGAYCDKQGDYSYTAQIIDDIVSGNSFPGKLMIFEAAGNSRDNRQIPASFSACISTTGEYGTIDPPATAKNSIAVGAINTNDLTVADFSSFGPTKDGRIKPDIVAPGAKISPSYVGQGNDLNEEGITSTYDASTYGVGNGTSFSTPVVAGSASLLIQKWQKDNSGSTPLPHSVKAILIHTAKPPPQGLDGPDFEYGWGILDIADAVDLVSNHADDIQESTIAKTNDIQPFAFNSLGSDVKATLVWDDVPSSANANPSLVNNLDVHLKDSAGNVFDIPFKCDDSTSCNSHSHQQGIDNKNNVKMIVAHGVSGAWTANVTGTSINQGPQDFTLVVSSYNPSSTISPPFITSPLYGTSTSGTIDVEGTAGANNLVELFVDGAFPSSPPTANSTGHWKTTLTGLSPGSHTIYAIQISSGINGQDSLDSNTVVVTVPTQHPPNITSPADHTSFTTNTISVSGTADSPDDVIVKINSNQRCTATVITGQWSCPSVTLDNGNNLITAEQPGLPPSSPIFVFYTPPAIPEFPSISILILLIVLSFVILLTKARKMVFLFPSFHKC